MLQINNRPTAIAADLEVVVVVAASVTFLGGGMCIRVECDPLFLRHLANQLHGVGWVAGGRTFLYIRDLSVLKNLQTGGSLTATAIVDIDYEDILLRWTHRLNDQSLVDFVAGDLRPCPESSARPFHGGELRVTDYHGDAIITAGDTPIMTLPTDTKITWILPAPATLNGEIFRQADLHNRPFECTSSSIL